MKVVVRHEAMAVARARPVGASLDEGDLVDRLPASDVGVDERIERDERKARSLEALAQLKPDERTALLLKAHGLLPGISCLADEAPRSRAARCVLGFRRAGPGSTFSGSGPGSGGPAARET